MGKNFLSITKKEIKEFKRDLYNYFSDPYDFEKFCKTFLLKENFDEVEVTRRNKDGGIDLNAIRKGFDNLGADELIYKIQAKRIKPDNSVSIESVRALRGVLNGHEKGIFITTGKYTKNTYDFVNKLNPKSLILISGEDLIKKCIELELGFSYRPYFDVENLRAVDKKNNCKNKVNVPNNDILKIISENDIKRRILSIPSSIFEFTLHNEYEVIINGNNYGYLHINNQRKFFSGVTSIFEEFGLIKSDGTIESKEAYWSIHRENKNIIIKIIE